MKEEEGDGKAHIGLLVHLMFALWVSSILLGNILFVPFFFFQLTVFTLLLLSALFFRSFFPDFGRPTYIDTLVLILEHLGARWHAHTLLALPCLGLILPMHIQLINLHTHFLFLTTTII